MKMVSNSTPCTPRLEMSGYTLKNKILWPCLVVLCHKPSRFSVTQSVNKLRCNSSETACTVCESVFFAHSPRWWSVNKDNRCLTSDCLGAAQKRIPSYSIDLANQNLSLSLSLSPGVLINLERLCWGFFVSLSITQSFLSFEPRPRVTWFINIVVMHTDHILRLDEYSFFPSFWACAFIVMIHEDASIMKWLSSLGAKSQHRGHRGHHGHRGHRGHRGQRQVHDHIDELIFDFSREIFFLSWSMGVQFILSISSFTSQDLASKPMEAPPPLRVSIDEERMTGTCKQVVWTTSREKRCEFCPRGWMDGWRQGWRGLKTDRHMAKEPQHALDAWDVRCISTGIGQSMAAAKLCLGRGKGVRLDQLVHFREGGWRAFLIYGSVDFRCPWLEAGSSVVHWLLGHFLAKKHETSPRLRQMFHTERLPSCVCCFMDFSWAFLGEERGHEACSSTGMVFAPGQKSWYSRSTDNRLGSGCQ